jgi:hypothetical protein
MKVTYAAMVSLLTLLPLFAHAEQYLCVDDLVTGFSYDVRSKKWKSTNFNAGSKLIISKPSDKDPKFLKYIFIIKEIGEDFPIAKCNTGFDDYGYLMCDNIGNGTFHFNKRNGRYVRSYTTGYFNVLPGVNDLTDATSDTPIVAIGKCSSF